ncbi:MAG: hypothetical protein COA47_08725 [Robiginitomaculum sp.]|nr:MAG: hypothetical protein COA47_08725 [Robiginitomaculum sp.]
MRKRDVRRAAFDLARKEPLRSAKTGLTVLQGSVLIGIGLCLLVGLIMDAAGFVKFGYGFLQLVFGFAILFRALLLGVHFWPKPNFAENQDDEGQDMPVYTILLPVYHEAGMLPKLADSISRIDYPKSLLDIKLLLEGDDEATLRVARKLELGPEWEVLIVPDIGPRTKPKALNVGLARARGSLVTIYDAEDRPHPDQLKAAVRAFACGGEDLGCVQAPLGVYNAGQNWLTRQFSLEYNAHFRVILPALTRLGLAFPLGGTSNHFRKSALGTCRGWDPYNVTEDADLGFRLAEKGWRSGVISPPTMEEATAGLAPWLRQRSRWIKGFLQTLLVHTRGQLPGGRPKQAFSFFAVLGIAVLSAFSHRFLLLGAVLCLACWPLGGPPPAMLDIILAGSGTLLALALLQVGSRAAGQAVRGGMMLSSIGYWPLQTWAAVQASIDLFVRPFHWAKTDHGHSFKSQ